MTSKKATLQMAYYYIFNKYEIELRNVLSLRTTITQHVSLVLKLLKKKHDNGYSCTMNWPYNNCNQTKLGCA